MCYFLINKITVFENFTIFSFKDCKKKTHFTQDHKFSQDMKIKSSDRHNVIEYIFYLWFNQYSLFNLKLISSILSFFFLHLLPPVNIMFDSICNGSVETARNAKQTAIYKIIMRTHSRIRILVYGIRLLLMCADIPARRQADIKTKVLENIALEVTLGYSKGMILCIYLTLIQIAVILFLMLWLTRRLGLYGGSCPILLRGDKVLIFVPTDC